ncbi:MAG: rRNA (cytosine1962-C5)-methyltransferase [Thermoanaerobaculia bacterium]|jgi:23S rRNA (cytosine1962-C5)-methyltransferase|nr:rRNA (cytosine1962-C5)-methyltransferase [Thermoanaerobaculia bacterium]
MDHFETANRRVLTLKPGKERLVANRHPWIFAGAIARESGPEGAAIADLLDPSGRRIASGFHSQHSQIRVRALTFGDEELTAETIHARMHAAMARRMGSGLKSKVTAGDRLLSDGHSSALSTSDLTPFGTNAFRLINAEGDELSGLIIDIYDDIAVVEIANAGVEQLRPLIIDDLQREIAPRGIWFKNDIPARKIEGLSMEPQWIGEGEASAEIRENGLRFRVDAPSGQKTGFFLDQRENRALTRTLAVGRRVLNLFSYSGAFGVYAAAGGASSVENVDSSSGAIELARTNHALNGSDATFTVADAFDYVRKTNARYDLLICDPPAFAKSRGDIDRAARGYKDINLFAMKLLNPGAQMLTFSCSGHMSLDLFQKVIFSAAQDAGRRVSFVRRLAAAPDHPVSLFCPEGEYLKGFLLEVH